MRKLRQDISSGFTHVTQRGIGRRAIFEDDLDKRAFLDILSDKKPSDLDIVAWCLMDNHMHLLFRADWQSVSKLMQRTQISYAQRFNGRHGHVGKVFQNRFASTPIKSEIHLMAAIRYIHRNAFDIGVHDLKDHKWSSYRQIVGITPYEDVKGFDESIVLGLLGGKENFIAFHEDRSEIDGFCDISGYRPRIDDDEARIIACHHFGGDFVDRLPSMPNSERDKALKTLKVLGLSIRQIERLTRIGRNIIARAK